MRALILCLLAACGDDGLTPMHDAPLTPDAPIVPDHVVAYISGGGPDIAWFDVDLATGALAPGGRIAAFGQNPSFLALTPTHLYAVAENSHRVGAYAIAASTGALTLINDQPTGQGPAHVAVIGGSVMVANYTAGSVNVFPLRGDGGLMAASQTLNAGANAHQVVASDAAVMVPCAGADHVAQYTLAGGALTANATAPAASGAGPRHLAFTADGNFAYVINERNSTVTAYSVAQGRLTTLHSLSSRAAGASGSNTGAEIAVSRGYVYASNRGDDTLGVFRIGSDGRLTPVGHVPTGGDTPRSFAIDPTGRWLLVGNQASSSVTTFAIDAATGLPSPTGASITAQGVSFVGFLAL